MSMYNAEITRKEFMKIAKERGIEVNVHWSTKFLANVVTNYIVEAHATMHQRAWESRRKVYGRSGQRWTSRNTERLIETFFGGNQLLALEA